MKIRVMLADDHPIVRHGLAALLASQPDIRVIGEAGDGLEVLENVEKSAPDVLVLDLSLPGLGGLEVIRQSLQKNRHIRIVVLSMYTDIAYIASSFRRGAKAYIFKDTNMDILVHVIRMVMRGETYINPPFSQEQIEAYQNKDTGKLDPYELLTNRERQVLHLVAEGLSNLEIANRLEISDRTAETHRFRLMRKLGLSNPADLTRYAIERGLILPKLHQGAQAGGRQPSNTNQS
jgi:DNA-binding NarL/FixJ family response regulator